MPATWANYFDRTTAMARVEDAIEHHMKVVLEDWELYRTTAGKGAA
jgi:hypothetical protein